MKICFPVQNDEGLKSTVFNHFGSAPKFVVVDTDTNGLATISNGDQHHAHSACSPMKALDNQSIDVIVVGGIGAGALTKLNQMGITVYRAQGASIDENMKLFTSKALSVYSVQSCCGGHSKDGGCAH
jgi:predicted Fe-Mo cluster-binding NifX family protein